MERKSLGCSYCTGGPQGEKYWTWTKTHSCCSGRQHHRILLKSSGRCPTAVWVENNAYPWPDADNELAKVLLGKRGVVLRHKNGENPECGRKWWLVWLKWGEGVKILNERKEKLYNSQGNRGNLGSFWSLFWSAGCLTQTTDTIDPSHSCLWGRLDTYSNVEVNSRLVGGQVNVKFGGPTRMVELIVPSDGIHRAFILKKEVLGINLW